MHAGRPAAAANTDFKFQIPKPRKLSQLAKTLALSDPASRACIADPDWHCSGAHSSLMADLTIARMEGGIMAAEMP